MEVKTIWTNDDFDLMHWHDNYIHSIAFPDDNLRMILDIDYLFEWELNEENGIYFFWVSPCSLIFLNVLNLQIDIDFKDSTGLDINNIKRLNPRHSPNAKETIWDYLIETDKGLITFEATGFIQKVKAQPVLSNSQILQRGE